MATWLFHVEMRAQTPTVLEYLQNLPRPKGRVLNIPLDISLQYLTTYNGNKNNFLYLAILLN